MTKNEFIKEVAKRCKIAEYVIEEIYNVSSELTIERLIGGENVELPTMGWFKLKERGEVTYKNLFGNKEKTVDRCIYPTFLLCNNIKNRVKNGHKYEKSS